MGISEYLTTALQLAKDRKGFCSPNPSVGAVIVKSGTILATGFHLRAGSPHAERDALEKVGDDAKGSTVYVTLEPCCHFGKTPPCTQALIDRGVAKVVYSHSDPNPQVAGKGHKQLEEAGIAVSQVPLPEIESFYESYDYWWKHQRPFVTLKLAVSVDYKVAGPNGIPVPLTSPESDAYTHLLRLRSEGILTTARTVIADNPRLTARVGDKVIPKPIYILDRQSKISDSARIYESGAPVTLLKGDWENAMAAIGKAGVHDLLVECGPRLAESLIRGGQVHRFLWYQTPKQLGEFSLGVGEFLEVFAKSHRPAATLSLGKDTILIFDFRE